MTERIDLKLALEAQLEGKATFAETDEGIKTIRQAVQRFADTQAAGAPIAEAYADAIKDFRNQALIAGLALGEMKDAVKDATAAIDRYRLAEAAGLPFDEALAAATAENTAAMEAKAAADTEEAGLVDLLMSANWGAIISFVAMALAIGGVVALLAPFIAVVLGAVVIVTAWAVAVSGAILLVAALSLGVIGLAIGMLVLVDSSKVIESRFLVLDKHLKTMYNTLVIQAIPAVKELLNFFDKMIPYIQNFASALIKWFSGELPSILSGISKVLSDLAPDFAAFGTFLGSLFDKSKGLDIGNLIEGGIRTAIRAVEGLLTNLFRLTKWFVDNPQVVAVAMQIFGWFGNTIQWIATTWAGWAKWIADHWPTIIGFAKVALQQFGDTWNKQIAPALDWFVQKVGPLVLVALAYIALHWDAIAKVLGFVVAAIIVVGLVLLALGVAFVAVVDWAWSAGQSIVDAFNAAGNNVITMINKIISAVNHIPGVNIPLQGYGGSSSSGGGRTVTGRRGGNALAEGGDIGLEGAWVGEEGPEFFAPDTPGRILPQQSAPSGGGMGSSAILEILKDIEDHLAVIRTSSPGVTPAAQVRRGG